MLSAKKELFTSAGGAYQISRSVRLRSSASAYFNQTPASAGNRKTWTWSGWVKANNVTTNQVLFDAYSSSTSFSLIRFSDPSGSLRVYDVSSSITQFNYESTSLYRDFSAWYHIVVAVDTTQATAGNRVKIYVNGVQITAFSASTNPSQNYDGFVNNTIAHDIGRFGGNSSYLNGYLTEINFIDGQALTPSSFGETNAITGVWQPKKYGGTYGTNGFYLNFSDNSAVTTSSNVGIGKDFSGNGNYWTSNSISVTAGVTYDSMLDVPTPYADGGNGRGNYATLNPLAKGPQFTVTDGNLRTGNATVGNYHQTIGSTIAVNTGKWYWEIASNGTIYNSRSLGIAFAGDLATAGDNPMWNATTQLKNYRAILLANSTTVTPVRAIAGTVTTATNITLPVTLTGSNTFMVAMDISAGAIWFGVDGTWLKSATTAEIIAGTTTNAVYTDIGSPSDSWTSALYNYLGASTGYGWIANFGQRPFAYTPPTGFLALNTQNLPTPTISNGASYMGVNLWTANVANPTIGQKSINVGFQPDLVWSKNRDNAEAHYWVDSVRGDNSGSKWLRSNSTAAEGVDAVGSSTAKYVFTSTGFDIVDTDSNAGEVYYSTTNRTYVGWSWNAGGSTVTNTSGSISAQVRANATAGFSVVTYTGNGTSGATVGHGLGVAPAMMIVKNRSSGTEPWRIYHKNMAASPATVAMNFDTGAASASSTRWNNTAPTSSVFTVGNDASVNANTNNYVAYLFAAVAGYSAFGSYTGNGSADGPFVYLGFRPRYLLIKSSVVSGGTWVVFDSARSTYNVTGEKLAPNTADSENSGATGIAGGVDFLSNGFKIRLSWGDINTSNTLIYAAFAEVPFRYANAR